MDSEFLQNLFKVGFKRYAFEVCLTGFEPPQTPNLV